MADVITSTQGNLGNRAWLTLMVWKLAITRLVIYSAYVAGVGYLGAMGNQTWASLDADSRFKLLLGIALGVMGVWLAFLDKTVAGLSSGNLMPPNGNGGTQSWTRTTDTKTASTGGTGPAVQPPAGGVV